MIYDLKKIEFLLGCPEYNWDEWCEKEADDILGNYSKLPYEQYILFLEGKRSDILKSPVTWGEMLSLLDKLKIDWEKL